MLYVFSNWMLRPLYANQVFIFCSNTFHQEPIILFISLIFIALAKIPSQYKMLGDIVDTRAYDSHSDVVPRHAAIFGFGQFIVLPILYRLEVHNAIIVEVLAGEDLVLDAGWMNVRKRMLLVVPAAKT